MSVAGDIGRNVRAYRRYFAERDGGEQTERAPARPELAARLPEEAEARLAGAAPAGMAEAEARLSAVGGGLAAVSAFGGSAEEAGAPFAPGPAPGAGEERAALLLLARLEREARLSAQDFGEE